MKSYLKLIEWVMENGHQRGDRTGTGTVSTFSPPPFRHTFDATYKRDARGEDVLSVGNFPLLTTKSVKLKDIAVELMWFLAGDTNIRYLCENGVNIWVDWPLKHYNQLDSLMKRHEFIKRIVEDPTFAEKWGDCGPVYGKQWRSWKNEILHPDPEGRFLGTIIDEPVDQINNVLDQLRNNPESRRIIVSAWNVADIDEMSKSGLPPCHTLFQFYTQENEEGPRKLSIKLYQRSCDLMLGAPYNIASYALLLMLVAKEVGMLPYEMEITYGDAHIYLNHFEGYEEQIYRKPTALPRVEIKHTSLDIDKVKDNMLPDRINLFDYAPQSNIRFPIAV